MAEEKQNQTEQNTVALIGMIFSIIGLILLITIIFSRLGLPLLLLGFILGIVGLFFKPRGKAWVAVCIPLVVFTIISLVICWIWSSIKAPTMQFVDWAKVEFENIDEETFDKDRFNAISNEEFSNIFSSLNEEDFSSKVENSKGSNTLEKGAYVFTEMLQQGLETSLERYNNGESPEITNNDFPIQIDIEKEENTEIEVEETNNIEIESESVEIFTESEENDIEQIINILE